MAVSDDGLRQLDAGMTGDIADVEFDVARQYAEESGVVVRRAADVVELAESVDEQLHRQRFRFGRRAGRRARALPRWRLVLAAQMRGHEEHREEEGDRVRMRERHGHDLPYPGAIRATEAGRVRMRIDLAAPEKNGREKRPE